jgi:hypothetical protein
MPAIFEMTQECRTSGTDHAARRGNRYLHTLLRRASALKRHTDVLVKRIVVHVERSTAAGMPRE